MTLKTPSLLYHALSHIPASGYVFYKDLADLLEISPRAVGNFLHQNKDPFKFPCFRVLNVYGRVSKAYAFGGAESQRCLLKLQNVKKHFKFPKVFKLYFRLLKRFGLPGLWPWYQNAVSSHDPEEIIIGAILTQNTSWKNVEAAFKNLYLHLRKSRITLKDIHELSPDVLAKLIVPARYFNQKAKYLKNVARALLAADNPGQFFFYEFLDTFKLKVTALVKELVAQKLGSNQLEKLGDSILLALGLQGQLGDYSGTCAAAFKACMESGDCHKLWLRPSRVEPYAVVEKVCKLVRTLPESPALLQRIYSRVYQQVRGEFTEARSKVRQFLLGIKGIGNETADTMMLYAFGWPTFVVDAYTFRLIKLGFWGKSAFGKGSYSEVQRFVESRYSPLLSGFNLGWSICCRLAWLSFVYQTYHALIVRWGQERQFESF